MVAAAAAAVVRSVSMTMSVAGIDANTSRRSAKSAEELRVTRSTSGRVALGPAERLLKGDPERHVDESGARTQMPGERLSVDREIEGAVGDHHRDAGFQERIGGGRCFLPRQRPARFVSRCAAFGQAIVDNVEVDDFRSDVPELKLRGERSGNGALAACDRTGDDDEHPPSLSRGGVTRCRSPDPSKGDTSGRPEASVG